MFRKILDNLREKWKLYLVFILLITALLLWYTAFVTSNHNLKIAFLDIGQGDAIYIKSPVGNKLIIDGGPGDALLSQVAKQMSFFDRTVDMIMVTNPDKDHFEGFIPLLEKYTVPAFIESSVLANDNPLYRELLKKVDEEGSFKTKAQKGQRIDLGGGAFVDILFPDRDVSNVSHNEGSIVAQLVYGKVSVLLTGDSTQNIEKYLIENGTNLKSTFLKVGHHGSRTSTSDEFVRAVSPEIAVISVGKDNSYSHPHKETLDTLEKEKVKVLRTDEEGTITFESDGVNIWRD